MHEHVHATHPLPPIVRTVLTQAARHLLGGNITPVKFETQVRRVAMDELEPRNLLLLVRVLVCGSIRFIIRAKATNRVCDMIEIAPEVLLTERKMIIVR